MWTITSKAIFMHFWGLHLYQDVNHIHGSFSCWHIDIDTPANQWKRDTIKFSSKLTAQDSPAIDLPLHEGRQQANNLTGKKKKTRVTPGGEQGITRRASAGPDQLWPPWQDFSWHPSCIAVYFTIFIHSHRNCMFKILLLLRQKYHTK